MNEIVEKYEAKLERLNKDIERKKEFLTEGDLEVLAILKILLTEVVTDLRAIRAFSK
jgi:predicted house-cleaning noncanonical NTP pyrophosphatase (MazG superfamily)